MNRTAGIVDSVTLKDQRVAIFGLGSVGSYIAAFLPYPLEELVLVDYENLELDNVERHLIGISGTGQSKAYQVRQYLESHHGLSRDIITVLPQDGRKVLDTLGGVDLVIDATSNTSFRSILNLACVDYGWPAIYAGVYAEGSGWEVTVLPNPNHTCYQCFQLQSPAAQLPQPQLTNYGRQAVRNIPQDLSAATGLVGAVAQAAGYASQVAVEILMGRSVESHSYRSVFKPKDLMRGKGNENFKAVSLMVEIQNRLGLSQLELTGDGTEFTLSQLCGSIPVNIRQMPGCSFH